MLSISVSTIDRLIGAKSLIARRIGRKVLLPHVELMRFSRKDCFVVRPSLQPNAPDLTFSRVRCIIYDMKKTARGVYEKVPGSGAYWIRYADSKGKLRREKAGRHSDAITLLAKRRTEILQRKKLPENFRAKAVIFRELCADAVEHSKESNTAKSTHELQLKINELLPVFGDTSGGGHHQAGNRPMAGGETRHGNGSIIA